MTTLENYKARYEEQSTWYNDVPISVENLKALIEFLED